MRDPNRVEFPESCELFFELFLLNFISQVSDIDACASFVAHDSYLIEPLAVYDNLLIVGSRRSACSTRCVCVFLMLVCVEIDDLTVNL